MAFRLVTVTKLGPMWYVHESGTRSSLERCETQEQAVAHVFGILAHRWECAIELLIYDERAELQEAWAINKGTSRKLDLVLPEKKNLLRRR